MLRNWLSGRVSASHAKGRGLESTLRFCFDEKSLKYFIASYVRYIQFRGLGLDLDETSMAPMVLLRLYAVIMASGNISGSFSPRFEKIFLTTFDACVAKHEYGTTT